MLAFFFVGMTGFEPATTRPPDVYATGLRYIPNFHKDKGYVIFCQSDTIKIRCWRSQVVAANVMM